MFFAQEQIWDSIKFETNGQVLKYLESDATIRGDYSTWHIYLEVPINQDRIERLLAAVNRLINEKNLPINWCISV